MNFPARAEGSPRAMSKIIVKWSGKEFPIEYDAETTMLDLKNLIEAQIKVKPIHQKILNLKHKGQSANSCIIGLDQAVQLG